MFAFILLAVHWFNPLCWVAFALVTADMEMSCDEKVLNENDNIRKEYSTAILSFAVDKKFSSTTPLCFSENSVKARIKNVLKFKKPKLAISIITGVLCLAIIIGCALNPPKEEITENESTSENTAYSPTENDDINLQIEQAFKSFDTSGLSSNPGDYIDKSSDAYTFLMDNKDYTIRYIYSRFLEGGQYDIYGHFYRIVMDDITGEVLKIAVYSGQEYFNEFLKYNQYLLKENGEEFMKTNYPYGYMLIEMMNNNGNTVQIQMIATQIRAVKTNDFKSDDSIAETISTITNSEYIDKFGNGINIYKFRYNEYITFYVSFDNASYYRPIGVTYYLNDWEYAYQNFSNPFESLKITTQSTDNKSDKSENVSVITPQEALKRASIEVKKQEYSEYFYRLRDNDILPTLSYRPIITDYDFVYNDNTEYVYTVGLSINEDDDTYNSCAIMIDAESGEIIAVKFFNSYDMV